MRTSAGRVMVIKNSPLHRQLTGLQWREQANGALKEDPSQPNHSTDDLIYGGAVVRKLFDSGIVVPPEGGVTPAAARYADPMGLDDAGDTGGGSEGAFDSWLREQSNDWGM